MSFYSSPTYHFGNLNPVFNATDYEPQNTTTLTEATADERYLKLSGGICTGSLTAPSLSLTTSLSASTATLSTSLSVPTATVSTSLSVPTATVSSSLTVPSITLSSNSISQTVGQVGYLYSTSISATVSTSGALTNIGSISSLPVGVYMISYMFNLSTNSSSTTTITKILFGFSTTSTSFSPSYLRNSDNGISETVSTSSVAYKSRTFIYQQSSTVLYCNGNIIYSGASSTIIVSGYIQALRIA